MGTVRVSVELSQRSGGAYEPSLRAALRCTGQSCRSLMFVSIDLCSAFASFASSERVIARYPASSVVRAEHTLPGGMRQAGIARKSESRFVDLSLEFRLVEADVCSSLPRQSRQHGDAALNCRNSTSGTVQEDAAVHSRQIRVAGIEGMARSAAEDTEKDVQMHSVEVDPTFGPAAAAPAASLDSSKIGGHAASQRLPSIVIDDSTDGSYDSSSSSESLHPLSRASGSDAPATPPPATAFNGAPYSSAAFRSPARHVRAKSAAPIGASPPKTPRAAVDFSAVSPDYPLPHPPFQFDILNHAPARNPMVPPGWKAPKERTVDENIEEIRRAKERLRRAEEQRRTREPFAGSAELVWEQAATPRTYLEYEMAGDFDKSVRFQVIAARPNEN